MPAIDLDPMIVHQDALEPALSALDQYLVVPGPQGLLRIGSSSRGELVGRREGSVIEGLGDVEYIHLAIKSSEIDSMQARARDARQEFAEVFQDVAVSSIKGYQLRRLRHRFWLWEAIRCGRIVAGHDFRPLLPRVTIETLDFRELNEILLWRMLKLVDGYKSDVVADHLTRPCDGQCFPLRFHVARQILDLTTWWLPRQGMLLPGFKPRVERFTNDEEVPSSVRELVSNAWLMRQTGSSNLSCREWVEMGSAALLRADGERTSSDVHDSRFGDSDLRSQATRFKFYLQRSPMRALLDAGTLVRSRELLYRQLRPLVEALTNISMVVQAPDAWNGRRLHAVESSKRSIEWVTAES